jgi:hypothetical protein
MASSMSEIKSRELVEQLVNTLTEIKCINIAELNQRIQFDRLEEITQANGYFSTLA